MINCHFYASKTRHLVLGFVLILFVSLSGCNLFGSDGDQFTNKMQAPVFVSRLFDSSKQTIAISHPEGAHVAWMGFVQSNDYKYFKITKVQAGSSVVIQDGMEIDGETYSANSNAVIENVSVSAPGSSKNGFVDGNITVAGDGDLKITIDYSPLIAVAAEDKPHEAYLIINYDSPRVGSVRLRLQGLTKGVKNEKCTQSLATMDLIEYEVENSSFDLYFCSKEVARVGQNNTEQDPASPNYHGASTNIAPINMTNPVIKFFQPDDETVCLVSGDEVSIPDVVIPIPDNLAPIPTMPINMVEGSFAECSLDEDGNILCDANIQIDALVSLSGFSLTNKEFTAEQNATEDCPDFGAISGSGAFGDNELTLILKGRTLSDQNTEEFDIVDSLILAEIKLVK